MSAKALGHLRSALADLRVTWYTRRHWKWVACQSDQQSYCCHGGYGGPDDSEFLGCHADRHNDWIASRWYRRWVANAREAMTKGSFI